MSSIHAAIDGAAIALTAVNWVSLIGQAVTVDATPNRVWTVAELRAGPIVYLFGGGSGFEFQGRNMTLLEQPQLFCSVLHFCGVDEQGQLHAGRLAEAELIVSHTIRAVKSWVVASDRFAPLQIIKPERFDAEQALKGQFLANIGFTLLDGQAL